jgi:hypothetical protein
MSGPDLFDQHWRSVGLEASKQGRSQRVGMRVREELEEVAECVEGWAIALSIERHQCSGNHVGIEIGHGFGGYGHLATEIVELTQRPEVMPARKSGPELSFVHHDSSTMIS